MATLEDLRKGASVRGIVPGDAVTVVDVQWYGSDCLQLTYKDSRGGVGQQLLYRDQEPELAVTEAGRAWSFDADGDLFRLASEAHRIYLAHLFDPLLAVHTSDVEPLPHQITGVYGEMLPRQPLRFLLADDPGSGKTVMAGLLIKELMVRGDLRRCLVVCPGNLGEQWQDELWDRFQLDFKIISNQTIEDSKSGNPYAELNLVITRLDHASRNDSILGKLEQCEWDLVVVDEAHKMSAHYYGLEIKETKRYKLGKLLSSPGRTRHLLLMTATPHSGKEEDFQLFLALLDGDRFEGRFRDGVHQVDASDLMRRMVKEQLVKFDGTPLFPERRAYTIGYPLSPPEACLYAAVTDYVREEMNRADRLAAAGEGRRGNQVGFALTILQRRLASSPEAIFQSLRRRRERLEKRVREEQILRRGHQLQFASATKFHDFGEEDLDDLQDAPDAELEQLEDEVIELASAAQTVEELQAEIAILRELERLASEVRHSQRDRKWDELSNLLQNTPEMFDPEGHRRKLIVFTEHKDTLNYLCERVSTLIGKSEAVVAIHGGVGREERRKIQESFTQDREVEILVATDAAGEGINLQRAHLMINYDLPWNPNRLEQRFGRIHRIGQTEVCHMWSLVARETREGDVFHRLLKKLEVEREALGGGVFDVLGRSFEGAELRRLIIEAIRYGDRPEVRERLNRVVDGALDRDRLKALIEERALAHEFLDARRVQQIREDMERAEARRLQPHFIRSFFLDAFRRLGGTLREREPKRFEITHVPAVIRGRDRIIGAGAPVLHRYERICFEKDQINPAGKARAAFVCPGHPLLDSTIDLVLERYRGLLRKGTVLIDPEDPAEEVRALVYLDHCLQDARPTNDGNRRTVSRRMQFVEIWADGRIRTGGSAPYLDYRPAVAEEIERVRPRLEADWMKRDLDRRVVNYAASRLVPSHLEEVRRRREQAVSKMITAVKDRLTKEINYWDHRANELAAQEATGRINARLNSANARRRANDLEARLRRRLQELEEERRISALPPHVFGGCLVVPAGLLGRAAGAAADGGGAERRRETELAAMRAVMEVERRLGFEPRDVSDERCGYDIESRNSDCGSLRFIEVKGREAGAETITVTKNEILTALNTPESFILAIVEVRHERRHVHYVTRPFSREPDFGVTSVNYSLRELLERGEEIA